VHHVRHHATVTSVPYRSTLGDVIRHLSDFDRGDRYEVGPAIFAERPWGFDSAAIVASEDAINRALPSEPGYSYVLEVSIADEVLSVWSTWRAGLQPTTEQATAAVIHYAEHDAYQPVE